MSVDLATLALKVEALEVDAASKKLDNLTAAGGRTEKAAGGVTSAFKAVGAALAAVAFAQSIRQAVELADSYTRIEGRLKLVTSSATELASVQNALYAISQRSRAEYLATADVYNRFAQATKGQGIAQTDLLGITETLNKAFAISGASTSEAAGAMVQLSQGFSSGVLRGDEFNTVMETGGRVVDLLADYLGVGRGELRGMAEDGKLTSDVLRNAIVSGAAKVNEEFDKMPTTVGQAGVVLQNVLGAVLNDANKSSEATAGLSRSILELASTIEANKPAILSVFTGIVESAGWAIERVAVLANSIKGMAAVAAGALSVVDFAQMNPQELTQWMTDFDHGMAGVRKELTETAAKLKELGEEDPELVDEGEFTKTQQRFESLRGQISAYENQITGASINSQAQVKGTLELLRQKAQQEKDVAAATSAGTGVQKLSADALEKLHGRLTPVHEAQVQYKKDLEEIEKAHKSGQLVGAVYSEALKTAKDRLDKATGASKEHKAARGELTQLNAEIRNYTDQARDAAQAADEWLRTANSAGYAIADLVDQYATVGMGEFAAGVYEQSKALAEARKEIDAYGGSLETIDGQIAAATAAYEVSNAKLGELMGKLGGNAAGSETQDANAVNALQEQTEKLLATLKELTAEKERLQGLQGGAEGLVGQIDESYRVERLQSAYSQIGAYTADIYAVLKEEYEADAAAFEAATGNKVAAQEMLERKMAELDLSNPSTSWARAVEIGLDQVADQARITGEDIRDSIVGAFDDINSTLVDYLAGDGGDWTEMLHGLSKQVLGMTTQSLVTGPAANWLSGIVGGSSATGTGGNVSITAPAIVNIAGAGTSGVLDSLFPDANNYSLSWWDDFWSSASVESGSWWEAFYSGGETASSSLWNGFSADGQGAFASIFSGLGNIFSGLTGGVSSAGSSLFSSIASALAFADGGVFNAPGISAYSNSIVTHPTLFPFAHGIGLMGEAGAEAVMPLTRNRRGALVGDARGFSGGDGETKSLLKELIASVKGQGNTRIINTFGDTEVANAMSGAAGERVILNAIKRNPSIIRQVAR